MRTVLDPFVFIPIFLYLIFTGVFVQHGLMNFFLESGELIPKRRYLVGFIFASTAFCLTVLWVLILPFLGFGPDVIRWSFYVIWLVAPLVGYLYIYTLAEHLSIEYQRVRWLTRCLVMQFAITGVLGFYTAVSGEPVLFSYEIGSFQSRIDLHLGGAFSPNAVTIVMVIFTSTVVLSAVAFFLREMSIRERKDLSLVGGILLTAAAIIAEQVGYLFQLSFIFSLMPLANIVEVMRITYLQTIAAGRGVEQAQTQLRRDRLQIRKHLTAISHDINTPVAALKLTAGQLKHSSVPSEITQRLTKELEYIHIVCANLMTLFQLELTSVNSSVRQELLSEVMERVGARFSPLAGEMAVKLNIDETNPPPIVQCDTGMLEQAVGNLVYNAIVHAASEVNIELSQDGDSSRIDIVDDGAPVPSFAIPSLSDRAYRTFLEQQLGCPGWGLGVVIGHAFAKHHEGALTITTRQDNRTAVSMTLALRREP